MYLQGICKHSAKDISTKDPSASVRSTWQVGFMRIVDASKAERMGIGPVSSLALHAPGTRCDPNLPLFVVDALSIKA